MKKTSQTQLNMISNHIDMVLRDMNVDFINEKTNYIFIDFSNKRGMVISDIGLYQSKTCTSLAQFSVDFICDTTFKVKPHTKDAKDIMESHAKHAITILALNYKNFDHFASQTKNLIVVSTNDHLTVTTLYENLTTESLKSSYGTGALDIMKTLNFKMNGLLNIGNKNSI